MELGWGNKTSGLRDFLYLDAVKLHSFVSQIQGGMVNEISETIKQLGGISAGLNIGIPQLGGKVDATKNKESERQQTIQLTDPAYFNVLYRYLVQEKQIKSITMADIQTRTGLDMGQFVEIRGTAQPPVVEYWIEQVRSLFKFADKNTKLLTGLDQKSKGRNTTFLTNQQMKQFEFMLNFLADYIAISRKDSGRQYLRVTSENNAFVVWCGLLPDFSTVPLNAVLPADVYVFGRVERMLGEQETWKIVDLSQFNQSAQAGKLIEVLNSFGSMTGQKIREDDLQAKHPDIFVTPLAIYR